MSREITKKLYVFSGPSVDVDISSAVDLYCDNPRCGRLIDAEHVAYNPDSGEIFCIGICMADRDGGGRQSLPCPGSITLADIVTVDRARELYSEDRLVQSGRFERKT